MPQATIPGGDLVEIGACYILIPGSGLPNSKIVMTNLPDISDQKSAAYSDENVIGRSSPIKSYSNSENRTISWQLHFFVVRPRDVQDNLQQLRALESALYPRVDPNAGVPFIPPPICRLRCGNLLARGQELCAVLKSYSVKFPTDVAWDEVEFTPYKFDVETSWDVVYRSTDLPGQDRIVQIGR